VRLFISKGAEVNVKVSLGIVDKSELFNTALSKVLPLGHDMVMLLLENGADPGLEKYGVQTLRNAALKNDWRDVLDLLDQKGFKDP
jgi:ankyrin repeat protein